MKPPPSPEPAWSAVQRGDRDALEWLFAEWMGTTLQWCRRLGGPRVDPEQAAQDVLLVVLRKVHTVPDRDRLPAWLMGVTRRVLAQHRRRAWPSRWDADADLERFTATYGAADPARRERATRAWHIIDTLPDDLRDVYILAVIEGRTDREAAELLDLPLGTLKSRLRRARQIVLRRATAADLRSDPTGSTP